MGKSLSQQQSSKPHSGIQNSDSKVKADLEDPEDLKKQEWGGLIVTPALGEAEAGGR